MNNVGSRYTEPLCLAITLASFLFCAASNAQDTELDATETVAESSELASVEEMVITGIQEDVLHAFQFDDFHEVNRTGEYYYMTRQYKKAFPYLLASAKRGFKMAQARVGFIYLNGLGEVEKSFPTGIGWLGVAAEPRSDPQIKNYYKRIMRKLPKQLRPKVKEVVAAFVERYGPDATGVSCIHTRVAGTHISKLTCNFKKEFALRDALFQDWMSTAFEETSGPFGTGIDATAINVTSPDAGGVISISSNSQGRDAGLSTSSLGSGTSSGGSSGDQ